MDLDPVPGADPVTLRLHRPDDVLAYLPYRFGYVPTDSLAVLAVLETEPGEIQLGLAARLDIADLAEPAVMRQAITGLCAQLRQDPTVCTFTVLYSEATAADVRARRGMPATVLARWLSDFPFADPTATFLVSSATFRCLQCTEPYCCPADGRSVRRLSETAIAARMVLAGEVLAPTRGALSCPRSTDPERQAEAVRAADRERHRMAARTPEQRRRWRRRMLDSYGVALAEVVGAPGRWTPDPAGLGRLGAALADPLLRDAVVAWTLGGERLRAGSEEVLDTVGGAVSGGLAPPSSTHLNAACVVLTEVARHAAPGRGGYPLAILGWLAWWRGEGARADVLLRQALGEEPGNSLGRLLADVLDGGVRPGWARPGSTVAPGVR